MVWSLKSELTRKAVHILAIAFILIFSLISQNFGEKIALLGLVFLLILFLELEFVRIELRREIPILKYLYRHKEKNRVAGNIFFLIGSIIALAVFDINIAIAAILMTVFGDMAAALVGKKFGKIKIFKEKCLEGMLAEFFVDLIIASLLINNIYVILAMALIATIAETLVSKIDDNLIIPLFAGFSGQIVLLILKKLMLI